MRHDEIRNEVLGQHRAIRDLAVRVEQVARPIASGDRANLGPLRERCDSLRERVVRHIDWEDRHLGHALRGAASSGEAAARRLERDHGEQLRVLEEIAGACRRDRLPAMVACRVLEWTAELCREMEREELALRELRELGPAPVARTE